MTSPWTLEQDYLLLYMRSIGVIHPWCAEILNREAGEDKFNKNMCIGRAKRLRDNGVRYDRKVMER